MVPYPVIDHSIHVATLYNLTHQNAVPSRTTRVVQPHSVQNVQLCFTKLSQSQAC